MQAEKRFWINLGVTAGLLLSATLSSLALGGLIGGTSNAQMLFLLAVLLVSRFTDGYLWGVAAAIVSVPLVNYMFTYPYFSFNLSISGYLLTFLTMMAVSLSVSVLTARIKQQEQIRLEAEKEKLRANLLRAVSHDLRTPLTSIVGATGAILDNALPPEKQRELLADVNADAQWLLRMIENQLAITRIQGDAAPLHTETEVVEDVLAEAAIKFQKHFPDIQVDMSLSDDILLADMDAVLIEQVVLNLLENAVYHGKHHPHPPERGASGALCADYRLRQRRGHPPRQAAQAVFGHAGQCERRCTETHGHRAFGMPEHRQGPRRRDVRHEQRTGRRERIFHAAGKGERVCRSNSWLLRTKKASLSCFAPFLPPTNTRLWRPPQAPRRCR